MQTLLLSLLLLPRAHADNPPAPCTSAQQQKIKQQVDSLRTLHLRFRPDVAQKQSEALNAILGDVTDICSKYAAEEAKAQAVAASIPADVTQCEAMIDAAKKYGDAAGIYGRFEGDIEGKVYQRARQIEKLANWNDQTVYAGQAQVDAQSGTKGTGAKLREEVKKLFDVAMLKVLGAGKTVVRDGNLNRQNVQSKKDNTPFGNALAQLEQLGAYFEAKRASMEGPHTRMLATIRDSHLCTDAQAEAAGTGRSYWTKRNLMTPEQRYEADSKLSQASADSMGYVNDHAWVDCYRNDFVGCDNIKKKGASPKP